jgi:hypothetical protein
LALQRLFLLLPFRRFLGQIPQMVCTFAQVFCAQQMARPPHQTCRRKILFPTVGLRFQRASVPGRNMVRPERVVSFIGDRGRGARPRARSFISQVLRAAAKANGGPLTPAQLRGTGRHGGAPRKGPCCRIGRGQKVADALKRRAAEGRGPRQRRVVIKARIVRHKLGSGAAGAHLRYLERDGTTRDGGRGELYGRDADHAGRIAFVERGAEDRHSFRFIVAPEDGDRLADLRGFTRGVMIQMEADLGTKLDWVAVDHFNTGHPHSHVVIHGKDDLGKDLMIAQDYITDGVRPRAQER